MLSGYCPKQHDEVCNTTRSDGVYFLYQHPCKVLIDFIQSAEFATTFVRLLHLSGSSFHTSLILPLLCLCYYLPRWNSGETVID